ncbi:MAG: hypothetical protein MUF63_07475 [Rhodobacteraceae bacterium]|nr:hypothetical protein [Paracoccaceae bacterium]
MRTAFLAAFFATATGTTAFVGAAFAQAPVGSPAGTITLDGAQLPPAPLPFGGKIEDGALQSTCFSSSRTTQGSACPAPSAA